MRHAGSDLLNHAMRHAGSDLLNHAMRHAGSNLFKRCCESYSVNLHPNTHVSEAIIANYTCFDASLAEYKTDFKVRNIV
jgi:hypothetical protein